MENADQVGKQILPDTELKLVQKVNYHHLGNTELLSSQLKFVVKPLIKGILSHVEKRYVGQARGRSLLTIVGTEDVDLSRASTRAPATAWPT